MNSQSNDNVIDLLKISKTAVERHASPGLNPGALQAALDIVARAHDDGWVLVPGRASQKMIAAARTITHLPAEELQKIWRSMLQA